MFSILPACLAIHDNVVVFKHAILPRHRIPPYLKHEDFGSSDILFWKRQIVPHFLVISLQRVACPDLFEQWDAPGLEPEYISILRRGRIWRAARVEADSSFPP